MGYDYDLAIVGGGGGGITAAMLAHGLGKKAVLIDRRRFGGECTWSGCVPSKSLLHAAHTVWKARHAGAYGAFSGTAFSVSGRSVMASVQETVHGIYEDETPETFEKLGITALENTSVRFVDDHTLEASGRLLRARKFLIATGSSPLVPPVPGLASVPFYTNETIFTLESLPASLAIMGGGPIGIELAQAMNRLGERHSHEMAPSILIGRSRALGKARRSSDARRRASDNRRKGGPRGKPPAAHGGLRKGGRRVEGRSRGAAGRGRQEAEHRRAGPRQDRRGGRPARHCRQCFPADKPAPCLCGRRRGGAVPVQPHRQLSGHRGNLPRPAAHQETGRHDRALVHLHRPRTGPERTDRGEAREKIGTKVRVYRPSMQSSTAPARRGPSKVGQVSCEPGAPYSGCTSWGAGGRGPA